jgi:biopolymer transport protein ExbB
MLSLVFETIRDFLNAGGNVLVVIFFTTIVLWGLIAERFHFFRTRYPVILRELEGSWQKRTDKSSWFAAKIREYQISKTSGELYHNISLIKALVALCPLLGLMGTVTGMIAVFDVMATTGTGNARLMASGISMATIPTMAGMVAALSGIYFGSLYERRAKLQAERLLEILEFRNLDTASDEVSAN